MVCEGESSRARGSLSLSASPRCNPPHPPRCSILGAGCGGCGPSGGYRSVTIRIPVRGDARLRSVAGLPSGGVWAMAGVCRGGNEPLWRAPLPLPREPQGRPREGGPRARASAAQGRLQAASAENSKNNRQTLRSNRTKVLCYTSYLGTAGYGISRCTKCFMFCPVDFGLSLLQHATAVLGGGPDHRSGRPSADRPSDVDPSVG